MWIALGVIIIFELLDFGIEYNFFSLSELYIK